MERDDRDARSRLQHFNRVVDELVEPDQLLVRGDAKRLKRERCRIDLSRLRPLHTPHDLRQSRRRLDRPLGTRGDDRFGNPSRHRLFAVVAQDRCELVFAERVDEVRGCLRLRPHAHVERRVVAEGKSARCVVELHR